MDVQNQQYKSDFYNYTPPQKTIETPKVISSLDTKSTSSHLPNLHGFRAFSAKGSEAEMSAVRRLYLLVDGSRAEFRLNRLDECRTGGYFMKNIDSGRVKVAAKSCHVRFCPLCSKSRENLIRHKTKEWLETIKQPKFMTFTMKHSEDSLWNQIAKLYSCFQKIRRHKMFRKKLRGGVWFFQIKLSKNDNLWHPHIHFVADCDFIGQKKIQNAWQELTGDSKIVDIRQVKDAGKAADYVARYAVSPCKMAGLSDDKMQELYFGLAKRRLSGTVGNAFKAKIMAKPVFEAGNWKRLFSFALIERLRHYDSDAKALWECWHMSKPLDSEIGLAHLSILELSNYSPPPPPTSGKHKQYQIFN
jgi:hypothetical protein